MASNSDTAPSVVADNGPDIETSIRLLCVDDAPGYQELMTELLSRENERFDIITATSGTEGLTLLAENDVDCIVSDYDMPRTDGLEFLEAVREEYPDLPFILFTGKGSEEIASEAISAGVNDYLQKNSGREQFVLLANRIENLVDKRQAESDLRSHLHQQELVAELGQDALSSTEVQTLLDRTIECVTDALDADYAQLFEYRPARDDLLLRAGAGLEEEFIGDATIDAGADSLVGYTLQTEEPVLVDAFRTQAQFSDPSLLAEHDVESALSIRIGNPDKPWGVFAVQTAEPRRFSTDDVTFLQSVVNILTSAIKRTTQERDLRSFKQAVEHAGHSIYCTDRDGTIRYANSASEEITGYTVEEVVGRTPRVVKSGEHDEEFYEEMWETILNGEVWQNRMVNERKDGTRYVVNQTISPVEGETGEIERFVAVNSEVTEYETHERELQRLKRRFETLFEQFPDMVFIHDEEGTIKRVNAKACDKLGYEGDQLEGSTVWDIDSSIGREEARELWENLSTENTSMVESVHECADGTTIPVEVHITLLNGESREFLTVARDITERKQRERSLQRRAAQLDRHNQRLVEFVDILSHDVPNHLDVAQMRLELAQETDEGDSTQFDAIANAHERIESLISDMQTLLEQGTQVETEEMNWLCFSEMAASCWDTCCPGESGVTLEFDTDGEIRAHESRFRQLLENLFWNACEHGGDGVTTRVGVTKQGFYVADDGPGIPEAERDDVLVAGYTTAGTGHSGFGLAIVREIARTHGWTVNVTESERGGARFEFTVPTADVRTAH